jgi:hypothetical protein
VFSFKFWASRLSDRKLKGEAMDTVFDSNQFTQNVLTIPAGSQPFSRTSTDSLAQETHRDYIRLELTAQQLTA